MISFPHARGEAAGLSASHCRLEKSVTGPIESRDAEATQSLTFGDHGRRVVRSRLDRARVSGKRAQTPPSLVSEARIKVRYAETDQMRVAYYANYLVWFEVGRSQYCNDCGFSYRDMEKETGLFLIVAEARCRYVTPARYEDELLVRTTITEITRRTVRFSYEIERLADGSAIARGDTLHVLTNSEGRLSSFPDKYMALFRDKAR